MGNFSVTFVDNQRTKFPISPHFFGRWGILPVLPASDTTQKKIAKITGIGLNFWRPLILKFTKSSGISF